jgi:hypothetical protein
MCSITKKPSNLSKVGSSRVNAKISLTVRCNGLWKKVVKITKTIVEVNIRKPNKKYTEDNTSLDLSINIQLPLSTSKGSSLGCKNNFVFRKYT